MTLSHLSWAAPVLAADDTGDGCCAQAESPPAVSAREGEFQILGETLAPVIEHFNATKDHARVVALLSPTCAGCVHAAKALKKEIVEKRKDADLAVTVVWVPTIASDDEAAAVRAAGMFQDERVTQFYDPARLSGTAWSRDLFALQARSALAGDTPTGLPVRWLETLARHPEKAPIWDVVFFYRKGIEWGEKVPAPTTWSKQTCFHAQDENGATGTFAVKSLAAQTSKSDWFHEVARGVEAATAPRLP